MSGEKKNGAFKKTSFKHGDSSIMVWYCVHDNGVGNIHFINGLMDWYKFLNILSLIYWKVFRNLNWVTAGCSGKITIQSTEFMRLGGESSYTPHYLETPTQSPDLNPIENIWRELTKIYAHANPLTENIRLKLFKMGMGGQKLTVAFVRSLMPKLFQDIIGARGYHTKYWNYLTSCM